MWDVNITNCVFMFVLYGWQRFRFSRVLWDFSVEHIFVKLPKPCAWWQKHVVLETMWEMERECCPLWKGMCPLAQVTMLNSARAPGKKTCHSDIPGDALCEPFIISLSHVCLLAYSRLSDEQTRGCWRGPSVREQWITPTHCHLQSGLVHGNFI